MYNFKNLNCWERSRKFCSNIYQISSKYPPEEKYGLTSQIRRASVSIASNIAEGTSRSSKKDFARFLEIAIGSAIEVQTQLIISNDLHFIDNKEFNSLNKDIEIIIKQVVNLKKKII